MTAIDTEEVLAALRAVGADLCDSFWTQRPVVEIDEMAEQFRRIDGVARAALREELAQAYPAIGWREDEFDHDDSGEGADDAGFDPVGEYWICDAIDGAVQFVRAIPNWSMSLTLMREGVPVFAAVFDAMHDEMFHAQWGRGAFHNGVPMRVNRRASHYHGIVATSQPPYVGKQPQAMRQAGDALSAMLRDVVAVRNLGPTSLQLAYVACGRLDGFWEFGDDGLNCIGAALLIREAGGAVTQADGQPYTIHSGSIAAAPPGAHASMLVRLREAWDV